jgi:hypothetical protein
MSNQVQTIETARKSVVEATTRAYGAERAYAIIMNTTFSCDWFNLATEDKSEEAKSVRAEKTALFGLLKGAKHSNPSTVWARIRNYGKVERYGEEEQAKPTPRSPYLRNMEELVALYKFNMGQDSLASDLSDANDCIVKALRCLGVDVSAIDTKN